MKRTVILAFLSLVSSVASAQEKKDAKTIPADVIDAFSMLYPQVKAIDWSFAARDFEVSFIQNERARSLVFDMRGNLMMVKDEIDLAELPPPVIRTVEEQYPDWSVQKIFSIGIIGTIRYELELENAGERVHLTCRRQGDNIKILSRESFK